MNLRKSPNEVISIQTHQQEYSQKELRYPHNNEPLEYVLLLFRYDKYTLHYLYFLNWLLFAIWNYICICFLTIC